MPNCEGACDRGGGPSGKPEIPTCDPAQAPLYPLGYGGATPIWARPLEAIQSLSQGRANGPLRLLWHCPVRRLGLAIGAHRRSRHRDRSRLRILAPPASECNGPAPFGFLVGLSVDVVGLWLLIFALPGLAADWMIYAFPLAGVVAVLAACTAWEPQESRMRSGNRWIGQRRRAST